MPFPAHERRLLLTSPGIGECVVQGLEAAGFSSLHQLRSLGVEQVNEIMCRTVGDRAWANRRRALARALTFADADLQARSVGSTQYSG